MMFINEIEYNVNLIDNISQIINKAKINIIRNTPDLVDLDRFYTDLGHKLGFLLKKDVDPINRKIIDNSWTTIKYDERYIHQTYKHSNKHQPLHTDYCNASIELDLVLLYCEEEAPIGGATFFIDAQKVANLTKKYKSELYERLIKEEVVFGHASPIFKNKAKVINYNQDGDVILYWNYATIIKENNPENVISMCDEFHEFLEEYMVNGGLVTPIYLKRGDGVIFHDKRILHGRHSYLGNRSLMKGAIATKDIENVRNVMNKLKN